jgi:hypothetical protein
MAAAPIARASRRVNSTGVCCGSSLSLKGVMRAWWLSGTGLSRMKARREIEEPVCRNVRFPVPGTGVAFVRECRRLWRKAGGWSTMKFDRKICGNERLGSGARGSVPELGRVVKGVT